MNEWIGTEDVDFTHRNSLYNQLVSQYNRYIGHVLAQVGGIYLNNVKEGDPLKPSVPVSKSVQKASLKWVLTQLKNSSWLNESSVTSNLPLATPASNKVCSAVARTLSGTVPENVIRASAEAGATDVYTIKDYYDDLYRELFASSIAGRKLTSEEKTLQREILTASSKDVKSLLTKSLAEDSCDECTEEFDHENCWCGWADDLGEGNKPYTPSVSITTIDESDAYRVAFVNKVKTLVASKKASAPSDDRAHYEYLYARCCAALER